MQHKLNNLLLMAVAALLVVACTKPIELQQYTINATTEQFGSDHDSKVHLVRERYIYWEYADEISIQSDQGPDEGTLGVGYLTGDAVGDWSDFNGVFVTTLKSNSTKFLGLFPRDDDNHVVPTNFVKYDGTDWVENTEANVQIFLKREQPWRNDSTFAKNVIPMVACHTRVWDAGHNTMNDRYNLAFHNLAALVRLQFYNQTGEDYSINRIEITDADGKQLTGKFRVHKYTTNDPYLEAAATPSDEDKKLVLKNEVGEYVDFNQNDLCSFYVILPAVGGKDVTTTYNLNIKLVGKKGGSGSEEEFATTSAIAIPTRRTGITYMNAVGVKQFTPVSGENGLVGNGTITRPFKIYTLLDLKWLRDRFNEAYAIDPTNPQVYINGQLVTKDTYFQLQRSDIVLGSPSDVIEANRWTVGIKMFKGHFANYAAVDTKSGITNASGIPLFESIGTEGVVDRISVHCTALPTSATTFSPLCDVNNGTINDARVTTNGFTLTCTQSNFTFCGICCTNKGKITASGVEQGKYDFQASHNYFAGVCGENQAGALVDGCFATSPLDVDGAEHAAGVVLTNRGTVQNSYFAGNIIKTSMSTHWGGVVYENASTGTIQQCKMNGTSNLKTDVVSAQIGGIACLNAGTIDDCEVTHKVVLSGGTVGAIAAKCTGGTISNCFINAADYASYLPSGSNLRVGGALVGLLQGGSLENSFAVIHNFTDEGSGGTIGSLVGKMEGGSVSNCYAQCAGNHAVQLIGNHVGGTLTRCWVVNATDDVAPAAQTDVTNVARTNADLNSLLTELSKTPEANWHTWQRDDPDDVTSLPRLTTKLWTD